MAGEGLYGKSMNLKTPSPLSSDTEDKEVDIHKLYFSKFDYVCKPIWKVKNYTWQISSTTITSGFSHCISLSLDLKEISNSM